MKKIFKGIIRNKYIYFILLLMNIVVIIFSGITYSNYKNMKTTDEYINSYLNIKDLYLVQSSWSLEDDEYVKEMNKIVDGGIFRYSSQYERKMMNNGLSQYKIDEIANYIAYNFPISEVKSNPEFFDKLTYMGSIQDKPHNVQVFLGKPFAMQIRYPIINGRNFIEADYENGKDYWNVLAGYNFMDSYKLGDELTIELPGDYNPQNPSVKPDPELQKVKIIGFIKKDTEVLENLTDGRLINADNKIIVPLLNEQNNDFLRSVKYSFLSMGSNYVITKSPIEVENLFFEEAKSDGYRGKGTFIQLKEPKFEYTNYRIEGNKESLKVYIKILTISTSILLFTLCVSILLLVRKNRYHYGVYLLTGATKNKILKDLLLEIFYLLILADVFSIIYFKNYINLILNLEVIAFHNILFMFVALITGLAVLNSRRIVYFIKFNNNAN